MLKDKKNNNRQAPQFNRVNQKLLVQRLLDNVTSGEGASQSLYDHNGNVLHASNLINRYKEYRISRVEIDIPTPAVVYEPTRPRGQAQQEGDWRTFSVDPLNEGAAKPPEPPPAPPKANNRWSMPKTQREEQAESGEYEGWVSYVDETGARQYYREQPAPEPEDGWKRLPQENHAGAHHPQAQQPADQYAPPHRPYDDASPQFYGAPQEPYTPSNYQTEQPYDAGYAGQQQYAADHAPAPDASRGSYDDYQQQHPDYGISQKQSSDRYPQAKQPPFEQTTPPQHSYRTEEEPQGKPYTMPAEPHKAGDPAKNPNEPSGKRTQSISARINQPGRKSGMHDLPPYWMVLNKQNQPSNEGQEEQGGQPQPAPEEFQQQQPPQQRFQPQPPQNPADAFQQQEPPQQRFQPQPPQNPADAFQQQQQPQQRFQPQPPQNPADAFQQQQQQQQQRFQPQPPQNPADEFQQQQPPQQAADAFRPQQPAQSTQGSAENQQTQPVSGAQPPQSAAVPTEQHPSWFDTVQDQSPPDQLTAWIPKEEPPWLPPEREPAPWEKLAAKPSTAPPSEPVAPPEPQVTEPAPIEPVPQSQDLWDAVESAQPAVDNTPLEPPPPPEAPAAPKDVAPWLPRAKRAKKPTGMPLAPPAAIPQPPRKPYQISEKTPSLGLPKAPQGPNTEQPAALAAPSPAQQTDHEADAPWLKLANDEQYKDAHAQQAPLAAGAGAGETPLPQYTPEADELQRTPEEESKRAKRKTIIEERSAIEGWLTNLRKDPPRRTTGTFRKPTLDGLVPPPPFLEKAPIEGGTLESNKPAAPSQEAPFSQPSTPAPAQAEIPVPAPQTISPAAQVEEPTHFNDPTPGMPLLEGITVDAPIMPKPVPIDEATITNRRKPRQKGTADGLTREISKPAASGAKPRRKVQRSERGTIEMVIDRRGKQVTPHYNKVGVLNSVDLGDGTKFVRAPGGKTWSLVAVDTDEILMEQLQSVVFDKDGNLFYTTSDGQKHMVFAIES
jgi:hypothetical protein